MIRPPLSSDAGRLAEIHVFGWRFAYHGLVPDTVLYVDRTVEKGRAFFDRVLAENPERVLVFDDGLVRGFALHFACRDSDRPEAHEVGALYVEPTLVRSGVGRALVAACEAQAQAQGRDEVVIWALEGNARARAFYEACGYQLDGADKTIAEWNHARELRYRRSLPKLAR